MAQPAFHHIHCSSRFDRSAASLEADIDNWVQEASIITLTEIEIDKRAAQMSEEGWGYYNAKKGAGADNCGIMWRKDTWREKRHEVRKLVPHAYHGINHMLPPVYGCSVLLRHRDSGHLLLVSVTHMPSYVQGHQGKHWTTSEPFWAERKAMYQDAMKTFSTHVKDLVHKSHADGVLVCADWNLNLKLNWVRAYFRDHWGKDYRQAWVRFPTSGGSLHGIQAVPLGAPGKGSGDSIIDGSLYHGLEVSEDPNLMHRVRSSDHRPYKEEFTFNHDPGKPAKDGPQEPASGDLQPGPAWWGFGDYLDDELYMVDNGGVPYYPDIYAQAGAKGGEVL